MSSPQDRIVKKMIDNIVEQNKPVFEKPAAAPATTEAAPAAGAPALGAEDYSLITRKLEYGFNSLRADNAELRKALDDISGAVKMLRNDMDTLRMTVQQRAREGSAPQPHRDTSTNAPPTAMGAPQYRKSAADEEFESKQGGDEEEKPQQARGFAKKKDDGTDIDIGKVFYYGKK